ncbi:MAG: ABC transporter substrate-binding protein, partial [Mesorhizobium sp.]
MMISRRGTLRLAALGTAAALVSKPSFATSKVRIGVLKFGTVSWALDTMKQHKFDTANGIGLEIVDFAGEDATNVAMLAGAIDSIVSDWLWVSRQRSEGVDLTLVPYSTAVGAIMVKEGAPIRTIIDLKGKKIGVAGGPLDKS